MTIPVLTLLTLVLCAGILIGGLLAVLHGNIVSAVISAGLSSLFASVVYVVLAAPDVAMTEASIGSGLTTMIFLYAIRKTQGSEKENKNTQISQQKSNPQE
ncbi:MAG: hydrogenase subunit MbhD domain-containing protein [Gammaproteobacteria bacterium]|nr:hydrogenase subunit MbhD domain-containing protein [Gammaproteobacteria bacterium]